MQGIFFSSGGEMCAIRASGLWADTSMQLPQAISRYEVSYHCRKDNITRRQADRTEAHFPTKCASAFSAFSYPAVAGV